MSIFGVELWPENIPEYHLMATLKNLYYNQKVPKMTKQHHKYVPTETWQHL